MITLSIFSLILSAIAIGMSISGIMQCNRNIAFYQDQIDRIDAMKSKMKFEEEFSRRLKEAEGSSKTTTKYTITNAQEK